MAAHVASVPDTQLGLSAAEITLLRTHQAAVLQHNSSASGMPGPTRSSAATSTSSRGRGLSRSSVSSTRAASAASSSQSHAAAAGAHRLLLDPGSLNVLGVHFDRLMLRIQQRVDDLTEQTDESVAAGAAAAARSEREADREIARMRECLRQIDELEVEFEKVRRVRDVVKGLRQRVDGVKARMR